ncbi:unnamed protein product [Ilex paraguariensis]|uniref:Secreted protein n=1 Tax=Ilex paraguariensis TaxID=185542 RepID=A0ABC8U006_9AQUA
MAFFLVLLGVAICCATGALRIGYPLGSRETGPFGSTNTPSHCEGVAPAPVVAGRKVVLVLNKIMLALKLMLEVVAVELGSAAKTRDGVAYSMRVSRPRGGGYGAKGETEPGIASYVSEWWCGPWCRQLI